VHLVAVVPGGEYIASVGHFVDKPPAAAVGLAMQPNFGHNPIVSLVKAGATAYLATRGLGKRRDYRLQVWNVDTGHRTQNYLFTILGKPTCFAVSPKGSRALLGAPKGIHVLGLGQQ
jgi:hypothetical protein